MKTVPIHFQKDLPIRPVVSSGWDNKTSRYGR